MNFDKNICPLCGKPNNCLYEKRLTHEGCWCESIKVPKELIDKIPKNLKNTGCICKDCILNYLEKNNM